VWQNGAYMSAHVTGIATGNPKENGLRQISLTECPLDGAENVVEFRQRRHLIHQTA